MDVQHWWLRSDNDAMEEMLSKRRAREATLMANQFQLVNSKKVNDQSKLKIFEEFIRRFPLIDRHKLNIK